MGTAPDPVESARHHLAPREHRRADARIRSDLEAVLPGLLAELPEEMARQRGVEGLGDAVHRMEREEARWPS